MKAKLLSIFALMFFVSMNSWAQFYAPPGGGGGGGIGGSVSVSLDPSSLTLTAGESATVTCTISGGTGFATWSEVDDDNCITHFGAGNTMTVIALKAGTATITATFSDKSASCTVTVNNPTVTANEGESGEYWATYYNDEMNFTADENTTVFQAALAGDQLTMTPVANREVPAGQAVILKSTSSTITLLPAEYTTATLDGNQLVGTTGAIANPGNAYVLNKGTNGVGFYKLGASGTIGANKAYLTYSGATAREYFLFDETAGISTTQNDHEKINNVYDLQGRRVAQPTKGLYIVRSAEGRLQGKNGKKVFINK